MSDLRLVYLCGEPGVGKSTLMREVTETWARVHLPAEPGRPARDFLYTPTGQRVAVELGRVRDAFSGTDALPSAVITDAVAYLAGQPEATLLLAEGARLSNRRFLTAAVDAGYRVQLLALRGEERAAERRAFRAEHLRKPEQNPSWVKGRRTASANLAREAPSWGVEVHYVDAAALEDSEPYREHVVAFIRGDTPHPPRRYPTPL